MNLFDWLAKGLGLPVAYRLFSRLVGGEQTWQKYLSGYVQPRAGEKVLDIGCGPGDVLHFLPAVEYVGLDLSPDYIDAARKRFGERGRFLCSDVGLATLERELGTFNLVMATGVLHHLDDERAVKLFALAREALAPGGRLMTYDGCFVPEQSRVARWLLRRDRGKFVRRRDEYLHLAEKTFARIESHLCTDLLRIPYTHLIMRCAN